MELALNYLSVLELALNYPTHSGDRVSLTVLYSLGVGSELPFSLGVGSELPYHSLGVGSELPFSLGIGSEPPYAAQPLLHTLSTYNGIVHEGASTLFRSSL